MQYAKFSGQQFEVQPLHQSHVQYFKGSGEIEKITKHNGHGQEDKFVYTIRPKFVEWSEAENESEVPKDKTIEHFSKSSTPSQKLRWWIMQRWEREGHLGEFNTYYTKVMNELIANQQDLARED